MRFVVVVLLVPAIECAVVRKEIPICPNGARPMYRTDGQPRKCLPHLNSLCTNALPDKPEAKTLCCWYNQVDYYCCLDVKFHECPDYKNITAVIHHASPANPFALRSYHFKNGIENEMARIFGVKTAGGSNQNPQFLDVLEPINKL